MHIMPGYPALSIDIGQAVWLTLGASSGEFQMRKRIPLSAEAIADDLADRIERGDRDHEPGSRLPSYLEMANLYGVSVSTIANVVVRLKERGLVVGAQGRGVFVAFRDD